MVPCFDRQGGADMSIPTLTGAWWMQQGVWLIRILLAGICGAAIGAERQSQLKAAGVREHLIVAVASALMMLISKYGFFDVIQFTGMGVDASRIAAGIITGIGILGGGLVFIGKRGFVNGLTTASGIWVTVGVGMAAGAGIYLLAVEVTVLILVVQACFHRNPRIGKEPLRGQIIFSIQGPEGDEKIKDMISEIEESGMKINTIKWESGGKKAAFLRCNVVLRPDMGRKDFVECMSHFDAVISYEI